MSDLFKNPDEWEQTYPNQLDGPSGHVYDARTQTYWRRKPQEPTYSPSPEAKALLASLFGYHKWDESDHPRIIDQALAAARQQGRDEGYADGHEAGVVKTMFDLQPDEDGEGHAHATPNQQVSGVAKDSQGAGFRIEPGLGTNGPDSDGSTVASPLRGIEPGVHVPDSTPIYEHAWSASPDGKVLVDRADLETLMRWSRVQPHRGVVARLVAALEER